MGFAQWRVSIALLTDGCVYSPVSLCPGRDSEMLKVGWYGAIIVGSFVPFWQWKSWTESMLYQIELFCIIWWKMGLMCTARVTLSILPFLSHLTHSSSSILCASYKVCIIIKSNNGLYIFSLWLYIWRHVSFSVDNHREHDHLMLWFTHITTTETSPLFQSLTSHLTSHTLVTFTHCWARCVA